VIPEKSPIVWEKRWFVVEVEGDLVKKQFPSYFIPDQKGYAVKMGCVRDFVPASKCYDTEQEADARIAELCGLLVVREELAEYAHNCWSRWMRHLFGKGGKNSDGSITLPREVVERWLRQMNTPYPELTNEDKASDREEANTIMDIVAKSAHPAP
jgi:hypothetical protein